jgi:ABC-type multidrug transport system ATPase subunit
LTWEQKEKGSAISSHRNKVLQALMSIFLGGTSVYGDVQTLWDVSLQVNEGEIVTLLGTNGAGKTTTLHTISGLLRPHQGSITFQDQMLHRESLQGNMHQALDLADRAYVLKNGRTVRTGTAAGLLADDAIQTAYLDCKSKRITKRQGRPGAGSRHVPERPGRADQPARARA